MSTRRESCCSPRISTAACRVVICVLTENWLNSSDCFNEFQAAWYMGKSILPLFFVDIDAPARARDRHQTRAGRGLARNDAAQADRGYRRGL